MQYLINGIVAGSAYGLVGISFAIIYFPARFFHFAHGAVLVFGAYFVYLLHTILGLPLCVSIGIAVFLSGGLGASLEVGLYRPLRRRGASSTILLVAALGTYVALQNVISMTFGDETKMLSGVTPTEGLTVLDARITPIQIGIVLVCLLSGLALHLLVKRSRFGQKYRAVCSNTELALVRGISVDRVLVIAFALGSGLAGLAGVLIALDVNVTPTTGLGFLIAGVVAMIIGGVGNMTGAVWGGLVLAFAQQLAVVVLGSQWQDAVTFVILITVLVVRPYGFFGKPLRKMSV